MAKVQESLLTKKMAANAKAQEDSARDVVNLAKENLDLEERLIKLQQTKGDFVDKMKKDIGETLVKKKNSQSVNEKNLDTLQKERQILKDNTLEIEGTLDLAGKLGDKIQKSVESIPFFGDFISEQMDLDTLGDRMKKDVMENLKDSIEGGDVSKAFENPGEKLGKSINKNLLGPLEKMGPLGVKGANIIRAAMRLAFGPVGIAIAAFAAIFTIVKNIRKAQREFGQAVGISRDQVGALAIKTKVVEKGFNAIGLDGSQIQGTLKEIVSEFGSLENMTVSNAANIERFAQNAGVSSSEVVKLNKVFMDLDGLSFDAATNVSRVAADLAKAAGVSTNKVIGDMASAASKFAEFSMDGAEGMARAAVEAAKVGANLGSILEAADSLLKFETSITAQFEAQVLTGKMINTERARQLALDGDIAGLTAEIQSIVGGVGDIQSLNVIQRKSVAEAIGISVGDLLKISRGEAVESQKTVQDYQKETNAILSDIAGYTKDTADKDNKVEMITPAF